MVGAGSIPVMCSSVLNAEIRRLWEALVLAVEKFLENRIVLEGDALRILNQFTCFMTYTCHLLLQNARLLCSQFSEFRV